MTPSFSSKDSTSNYVIVALLSLVGVTALFVGILAGLKSEAANISFVGRGIVKPGGGTNEINVYWTVVPDAVERIRGLRSDVTTSNAKIYKWEVKDSTLTKRQTGGLPAPGQEVVVKGKLRDDDRVDATEVLHNYRSFVIEGTLQGRELDSGKIDEGWVTVQVTSSKLLGVSPVQSFKEARIKATDVRFRIDGRTKITALGKSKHLDEVTAGQQKVRIEGAVEDEDIWVAIKFDETNKK